MTGVLCSLVAIGLCRSYRTLPSAPESRPPTPALAWPEIKPGTEFAWSVLHTDAGAPSSSGLAGRYRLAGTFFTYGGGQTARRKAVIDSLQDRRQYIVGENDMAGTLRVLSVFYDHIAVLDGDKEAELWLKFSSEKGSRDGKTDTRATSGGAAAAAQETSRFGRRLQENRWLFGRDKLLGYYQELLDEPERLVKVFDSLKPLYDENRKINGYLLKAEGEQDFFKAVGLQDGDIVRRVNSMDMTNRRRAEYFINEFVKDRVNAFVIDIERGGGSQKLIYEVR